MTRCETCGQSAEHLNDADQCADCHEAWADAQMRHWWLVYQGEKRAGLHGEFSDEGLQMRLREMRGTK